MIATSGGLPAASRVRMTGSKSRAVVYSILIPVFFVNAFATLMNASFSLPPQSESTSMLPALCAAGFELAVAANVAATVLSTKASRTNQERRFNFIPPRPRRLLPGRHLYSPWPPILPFSTRRNEAFLGLRVEEMQLVVRNRELDPVADFDLSLARYERHDVVALGVRVQQLLVAEVLDHVDFRREADSPVARPVRDLEVLGT